MKDYQKYHVQQVSASDNGVACLKSVLAFLGTRISLQELRDISGSEVRVCSLLSVLKTGRSIGLQGQGYKKSLQLIKERTQPAILLVDSNNNQNSFVVCYGFDGQYYWLGDPRKKRVERLEEKDLQQLWQANYMILFDTPEDHLPANYKYSSSWDWYKSLLTPDSGLLFTVGFLVIAMVILSITAMMYFQFNLENWILDDSGVVALKGVGTSLILGIITYVLYFVHSFLLSRQEQDLKDRINLFLVNRILARKKDLSSHYRPAKITEALSFEDKFADINHHISTVFLSFMIVLAMIGMIGYIDINLFGICWCAIFVVIVIENEYKNKLAPSQKERVYLSKLFDEKTSTITQDKDSLSELEQAEPLRQLLSQKQQASNSLSFFIKWFSMCKSFKLFLTVTVTFGISFYILIQSVNSGAMTGNLLTGGLLIGGVFWLLFKMIKSVYFLLDVESSTSEIYDYFVADLISENVDHKLKIQ